MIIMKKEKIKKQLQVKLKQIFLKNYKDGAVTYYPHGLQPNIYIVHVQSGQFLSTFMFNQIVLFWQCTLIQFQIPICFHFHFSSCYQILKTVHR
jgi:hypothetical protein